MEDDKVGFISSERNDRNCEIIKPSTTPLVKERQVAINPQKTCRTGDYESFKEIKEI